MAEADNQGGNEYHIPFHNYAGPGTHVLTRIERGDQPINDIDAAALVHDLEYIRDNSRIHADAHMALNMLRATKTPIPSMLSTSAFAIDAVLGNNRTLGKPHIYEMYQPKAKNLLINYPGVSFDS